jgi:hypothetical protein
MKNEYVGCGLYPENIDVDKHGAFRNICYVKKGTISGIYINELVRSVENVIKVYNGELEIVELVDTDAASILTHNKTPYKPHNLRENAKTDLKRVSINRIPKNTYNKIMQFIEDNYGTKYGVISDIVNQAMELYIKQEKGFVKLVKTPKRNINNFIYDNKGQINSFDINNLVEAIKTLNIKMHNLENGIEEKVKYTVQSTFDLLPKSINKTKKLAKKTFKSFRRVDKFEKALNTLENVMKFKEFGFTDKDYHKCLVKLTGQGDMRTVRSDLAMLEADNRVKKLRNTAHGTSKYEFIINDQYHRYNTELARKRFIEGFKEAFQNLNALTVVELNDFIFDMDGLHDTQSQYKRLKWLIAEGYVERHEANPRLLFIQK